MTFEAKEIAVGALTAAAFVGGLVFVNQGRQLMPGAAVDSTILSTKFNQVDGLIKGSEVWLAVIIRMGTIQRMVPRRAISGRD